MLALVMFNIVPLVVALLIGIVTARWMFAGRRRGKSAGGKAGGPDGS
jgi:hypothetical protein